MSFSLFHMPLFASEVMVIRHFIHLFHLSNHEIFDVTCAQPQSQGAASFHVYKSSPLLNTLITLHTLLRKHFITHRCLRPQSNHEEAFDSMKHEDGIEVYLKPRRHGGDDLRFPETELSDEDPLRARCCVPVIEQQCDIVIRFSKDFDLFAANAMSIASDYHSPSNGHNYRLWAARRSLVVGQQYREQVLGNVRTMQLAQLRLEAHCGTVSSQLFLCINLIQFIRKYHQIWRTIT